MGVFENRIPTDYEHRIKWINAIEKIQTFDDKSPHASLCQLHFNPEDFASRGNLTNDAVPTLSTFNTYEIEYLFDEDDENRL